MEHKCHRWYNVNLLISEYLQYNRQGRLAIDVTGSRSMKRKIPLTVFINIQVIVSKISGIYANKNVNLSLASQMKCDYCELNGLPREYIVCSHVKLNKVGLRDKISLMEHKCHRWYNVNLLISEYLQYNRQGRLAIDVTGSRSMKRKIPLTVFINIQVIVSKISGIYANKNVNLSLASQMKCDNIFLDPESDHIFSHFFSDAPGLYFVSSCMW